jgi:GWxTD domain-containing protein
MIRLTLLLVAICSMPAASTAQDSYLELAARHGRARVYHEALVLPSAGEARLLVPFRIPNSLLVFVRNTADEPGRPFAVDAELTVQLLRGSEKVAEEIWRTRHFAASFEDTQSKTLDLQGVVSFPVEPGHYSYRLILSSEHGGRPASSALRPVEVSNFEAAGVSRAILLRGLEARDDTVVVETVGLGGDAPYGQPVRAFVVVSLPEGAAEDSAVLTYSLFKRGPVRHAPQRPDPRRSRSTEEEIPSPEVIEPTAADQPLSSGRIDVDAMIRLSSSAVPSMRGERIEWPVTQGPSVYLATVDLGGETLHDGTYLLAVRLQSGEETADRGTIFTTHWRDMPLSLYSSRMAIRNLSFVEDRKTVRDMLRGSDEQRQARIRSYWAERDPTPGTVFNELMHEYYQRVDHAAFAFSTGRHAEPDGLSTDRARIYIVNGPPVSVERRLAPSGGVQEVWTYEEGKEFVFWAPGSMDAFELQTVRR